MYSDTLSRWQVSIAKSSRSLFHCTVLLVIISILKGFVWTAITPPLFAYDEGLHFSFAWNLSRSNSHATEKTSLIPTQLKRLSEVENLKENFYLHPLKLSSIATIQSDLLQLRDLAPDEGTIDKLKSVVTQPNFNSYHAPLYYFGIGLIDRLILQYNIVNRIMVARVFSIVLGALTVYAAVQVGRTVFPRSLLSPILLGVLVCFHPMLSYTFASVSDIALETFLSTLALLIVTKIISQNECSPIHLAVLSVVCALGVLTKVSFIALVVPIIFSAVIILVSTRKTTKSTQYLSPYLMLALIPLAVGASWCLAKLFKLTSIIQSFYKPIPFQHIGPVEYILKYKWLSNYSKTFVGYWGGFGWGEVHYPVVLYAALAVFTLLTVTGTSAWFVITLKARKSKTQRKFWLLNASIITSVLLFYIALDYLFKIIIWGYFVVRGQYYLPAVTSELYFVVLLVHSCVPLMLRRFCAVLIAACFIALNLYSIFFSILPRYWGTEVSTYLARSCMLNMLNPILVLTALVGFLATSAALLLAMSRTSAESEQSDHDDNKSSTLHTNTQQPVPESPQLLVAR